MRLSKHIVTPRSSRRQALPPQAGEGAAPSLAPRAGEGWGGGYERRREPDFGERLPDVTGNAQRK